jgi:hypothetical protein
MAPLSAPTMGSGRRHVHSPLQTAPQGRRALFTVNEEDGMDGARASVRLLQGTI